MNTMLWIVQVLLALVFLAAGIVKITRSKEQLVARMEWVEDFTPNTIGIAETLGALGLVLPAASNILTWLTLLAAVGLAVVMFGAVITHVRRSERTGIAMPGVLLVLAAFMAYGRFLFAP